MRYLLTEDQYQEIADRQKYLYDIFRLYFLPQNSVDGFIPLVPVGTAEPSILFIIGHRDVVLSYLIANIEKIEEDAIVIVTCLTNTFKQLKKYKKKIYTAIANNNYVYRYCGQDYGFNFDITESELNFYNSSKSDVVKRIEDSFQRL